MSLYIEFEPHSWYRGFAIQHNVSLSHWIAFTDNGNTYRVDELTAKTLKELKQKITEYRSK